MKYIRKEWVEWILPCNYGSLHSFTILKRVYKLTVLQSTTIRLLLVPELMPICSPIVIDRTLLYQRGRRQHKDKYQNELCCVYGLEVWIEERKQSKRDVHHRAIKEEGSNTMSPVRAIGSETIAI
jgi:hypothetical protein